MSSTATNCAEPPGQVANDDGGVGYRSKGALQPRLGEPDVGDRARAIELGLQARDLRVEHVGVGRDAGL